MKVNLANFGSKWNEVGTQCWQSALAIVLCAGVTSAQISVAPPTISGVSTITTVVRDSSGMERVVSNNVVRLRESGDDVILGWDAVSGLSAKLIVKDAGIVSADSGNTYFMSLGASGGNTFIGSYKAGTGVYRPFNVYTNAIRRLSIDTSSTGSHLYVGDANSGVFAGNLYGPAIQVHSDTGSAIGVHRIYAGASQRAGVLWFDDINDKVRLLSLENGTPPGFGNAAYPLTMGVGSNIELFEVYEDSVAVNADAYVHGTVTKQDQLTINGAAFFGATTDTIADIIPTRSFAHTGGDTAYYDFLLPSNAESIDSLWAEAATAMTTADSAQLVLAYRFVTVNNLNLYAGTFVSQSSSIQDLGSAADTAMKLRFTTAIDVSGQGRKVMVLKIYRDNSIADNSAGPLSLVRLTAFGKGLK